MPKNGSVLHSQGDSVICGYIIYMGEVVLEDPSTGEKVMRLSKGNFIGLEYLEKDAKYKFDVVVCRDQTFLFKVSSSFKTSLPRLTVFFKGILVKKKEAISELLKKRLKVKQNLKKRRELRLPKAKTPVKEQYIPHSITDYKRSIDTDEFNLKDFMEKRFKKQLYRRAFITSVNISNISTTVNTAFKANDTMTIRKIKKPIFSLRKPDSPKKPIEYVYKPNKITQLTLQRMCDTKRSYESGEFNLPLFAID